ncbi:MAG: hypothetical protein ACK46X_21965 [Candidatus Sericytochromatia bacterium]
MDSLHHIPRPAALGSFSHHHREGLGHPDPYAYTARQKAAPAGEARDDSDFARILDRLIAR